MLLVCSGHWHFPNAQTSAQDLDIQYILHIQYIELNIFIFNKYPQKRKEKKRREGRRERGWKERKAKETKEVETILTVTIEGHKLGVNVCIYLISLSSGIDFKENWKSPFSNRSESQFQDVNQVGSTLRTGYKLSNFLPSSRHHFIHDLFILIQRNTDSKF